MPRLIFELVRDARGSVVHVRHRQSGECIGCIEAGLFEIVAALVLEERGAENGCKAAEGAIRWRSRSPPKPSRWREERRWRVSR